MKTEAVWDVFLLAFLGHSLVEQDANDLNTLASIASH